MAAPESYSNTIESVRLPSIISQDVPDGASEEEMARIIKSTEISSIPSIQSFAQPLRMALYLAGNVLGGIIRR